MTRDDSCLYTQDASSLVSRSDIIRDAALKAHILPKDRLITGGDEWENISRATAAAAKKYDDTSTPTSTPTPTVTSSSTNNNTSSSNTTEIPRYGTSGNSGIKDKPINNNTSSSPRTVRPESTEDIFNAVARGSGRKSGAK
jgi:hypothetical protein